MIRRGQGRKAATKARKNGGNTLVSWSIRMGLVLVVALVCLFVVPLPTLGAEVSSETPTAQTTTTETTSTTESEVTTPDPLVVAAGNQYRQMRKFRKRADFYYHRLHGRHHPRAHGLVHFTGNYTYEKNRRVRWQRIARKLRKQWLHARWEQQQCRAAGFPRWYCPILIRAAAQKGVRHWSRDAALAWVISHESGFNPRADNPTSTAYGLFQMLTERSSSPYQQTLNGIRYVQGRYGSPANAKSFWLSHNWY